MQELHNVIVFLTIITVYRLTMHTSNYHRQYLDKDVLPLRETLKLLRPTVMSMSASRVVSIEYRQRVLTLAFCQH